MNQDLKAHIVQVGVCMTVSDSNESADIHFLSLDEG